MRIAVVTGASSGLGREYILQINSSETNIDEIWAIARRRERLEELKAASGIPVRVFPLDLLDKKSIAALGEVLDREKPVVALLINAAGFGKIGGSLEVGMDASDRMIGLNCRSAVDMTFLCIPYMERGSRIMEVCSTAAFQPFQYLNVYAASKAFLYRFSRALRVELLGKGIRVTAVCPYWIRDTEFIPVARTEGAETGRDPAGTVPAGSGGSKAVRHFPLSSKVSSVASHSLRASRMGLPVSTPGIVCTLHWIFAKFIPSELMMGIWALLRRV